MIVYSDTCGKFKEQVDALTITQVISESYRRVFHRSPNPLEEKSWENSLNYMERVVRTAQVADDCGVLIEYNLPNTSRRIDFIITGENSNKEKNLVLVELKQWQQAEATDSDGIVKTVIAQSLRETSHPSYQAYGYRTFLNDFNEEIYSGNICARSCAYLHNYLKHDPEPLLQPQYTKYIDDSPIFFRGDNHRLADFIASHVGRGRGMEILYAVENGKIRPSKRLVDAIGSLFNHNQFFTLIDEQKVLYENLIRQVKHQTDKHVVIIQGGPGTGKSVVSFNLLWGMLRIRKNVVLAAPNAAFREVMKAKLMNAGFKKKSKYPDQSMALDSIICGSAGFFDVAQNTYDVIIVDEAHRLKDRRAYQYRGENQIEDIISAASLSIFFVDDLQAIRPEDIGSVSNIRAVAAKFGIPVLEHKLDVQFRCAGMHGYINWLDHSLQMRETGNYRGWDQSAFEVEICESPRSVQAIIQKRISEGFSARILAGYAWKWTSEKEGNPHGQVADVVIKEHDFSMPWNSRSARSTWAIDESGIDQIGCIHTSQGLEFDYAGVIIGPDLQFDPKTYRLFASWQHYKDNAGKKGLKDDPDALTALVKNIYKTLMSRATRGCYVYCCDKEVEKYLRACLSGMHSVYGEETGESYAAE